MTMNLWDAKWDLDEAQCPCDIHFNDWIVANKIAGKTIYHFGTGTHHIVGIAQAANGLGNFVFAITASVVEYDTYIKLVSQNHHVAKSYVAYFGDIYLTDARMLPMFDVVTLFHANEYIHDDTPSAEYGGLDDLRLARVMVERTRPGGHVLFYRGSFAWDKTDAMIATLSREGLLEREGEFKSLLACRKV